MRLVMVTAVAVAVVLAGCGGGSDGQDETTSDEPVAEAASAAELTAAYGGLVGTCVGVAAFNAPLNYRMRKAMRDQLQVITDTVEVDPETLSADRMTAEETLYDLLPTLKKCDQGLATEAQSSIDRIDSDE